MTRNRWLAAAAVVVIAIVVGGWVAYDQFLRGDAVAPLALPSTSPRASSVVAAAPTATPAQSLSATASPPRSSEPSAAPASVPVTADPTADPTAEPDPTADAAAAVIGTWAVSDGSVAGYRVREKLAGLSAESDAVGRTESVTGAIVLAPADGGAVVESGAIKVDMTTLASDKPRRDQVLEGRAIETREHPTTTFTLTEPVEIPAEGVAGEIVEVILVGDLELHGVTNEVSIPAQARLNDGRIEVAGSLTFPFADFEIEPPNIAGVVSVADEGTLEFLLVLVPA